MLRQVQVHLLERHSELVVRQRPRVVRVELVEDLLGDDLEQVVGRDVAHLLLRQRADRVHRVEHRIELVHLLLAHLDAGVREDLGDGFEVALRQRHEQADLLVVLRRQRLLRLGVGLRVHLGLRGRRHAVREQRHREVGAVGAALVRLLDELVGVLGLVQVLAHLLKRLLVPLRRAADDVLQLGGLHGLHQVALGAREGLAALVVLGLLELLLLGLLVERVPLFALLVHLLQVLVDRLEVAVRRIAHVD
mmetsp:Transcript_47570/g.146796  ORF Transcript_47570/g.146796 Transcript_47570/m.146796 type:complete len:249 (+) Transcript_47570:681-1427(+)